MSCFLQKKALPLIEVFQFYFIVFPLNLNYFNLPQKTQFHYH